MPQILLQWFVAEQQSTTLWLQNCRNFYVKFSAESNGLALFF